MSKAYVYTATEQSTPEAMQRWLDNAPAWRAPAQVPLVERSPPAVQRDSAYARGERYSPPTDPVFLRQVNLALLLRRPLLVEGDPGLGKSMLAYHLAWALNLGAPLRWEINSRSSLQDGLYAYDAVAHLQAVQAKSHEPLGAYITLGPLGTALAPYRHPRLLLVDELDKSSYDLPNDLLHVLEEAAFSIPELVRLGADQDVFPVDAEGANDRVRVQGGVIRAHHHAVVVITSNGEREFPVAFLRRCVRLRLERPNPEEMARIVRAQLGEAVTDTMVQAALTRLSDQATDVVLQALYSESAGLDPESAADGLRR